MKEAPFAENQEKVAFSFTVEGKLLHSVMDVILMCVKQVLQQEFHEGHLHIGAAGHSVHGCWGLNSEQHFQPFALSAAALYHQQVPHPPRPYDDKRGWMGGWVGGWMDGWMDGWVDGWMDGWVDGSMEATDE
ncbi:hypothetical protein CRENBAI_009023, partial [Crenichthys baileyi]